MGNLRVSNEVILAKVETTYNTDPTPTAGSNAVLVQNLTPAPEGLRMQPRPVIRGNLNDLQAVFGGQLMKLTFDVEVKGSGTAGTAPELDALLRGCALHPTVIASTSVTYNPISTGHESVTIYWYEGGQKLHKLTGARGDWSLSVTAGGIPVFKFVFTGHYTPPTDQSQPTPTYNTHVPNAAIGIPLTIGGTTVTCRDFTIAANNKVAMPPSLGASDGYSQIQITDQAFKGQMTIEAELSAVIDVDAQLVAGTASTLSVAVLGGTAGNKFQVTGATSGLYWMNRDFADGDGLRLRKMSYGLVDNAGNDSVALAFT